MKKQIFSIKKMSFIAIFSALSVLFYTIVPKISLPIFPPFLELNFSMIPIVICSFMLGPIEGSICVIIRCLIKLPMTTTGFVGEVADLLIGLSVAIVVGLLYNHTKFKHRGLWAFLGAFVAWIVMGVITNAFINIPFYSATIPGGMDVIIAASNQAFQTISGGNMPVITNDNFMTYYLLFAVVPFNSLLALIVIIITLPIHKRLKVLYDGLR